MAQQFTYLPTPEARHLAQELAALRGQVETVQAGLRATQLGYSTLHGGYIVVRDSDGVIRQVIGRQDDNTYGQVAANGPPPSRPNTPEIVPIMAGLEIRWNGTLVDALPRDFSHILVYVSPAGEDFITGPSNLAGTLFRAGSLPVAPLEYSEHWVRFVAVNTSGEESEESLTASGTPTRILGTDLFPAIITETEIADDAISTPKLKANAVTALNIAAEAIQAGHIQAGAVTAAKLAATLVLASRVELHDADDVTTLLLDGATGDVLMLGEMRTALTGARWTINPGNAAFQNVIRAEIDGDDEYVEIAVDTVNSNPSIGCFTNSPTGVPPGGCWVVNRDEAVLGWLTADGATRPHSLRAITDRVEAISPIVALTASGTTTPASGVRRIVLAHTDGAGATVSESLLEHVTVPAGTQALLRAPTHSIGLRFGASGGAGRLFVMASDGTTRRSIEASEFAVSSGRAGKRKIRDLDRSALDIVRAAPVKEWEYDDPTGAPAQRHVGPMAEDLPELLAKPGEDGPTVGLRDQIGVLWAAISELAAKVDQLGAHPGPVPPRT